MTAKSLVILGAGTAGTIVANKLRKQRKRAELEIVVVDQDETHHYQPGYLFVPFGANTPEELVRPRRNYLDDDVELVIGAVDRVDADASRVFLEDGRVLSYDYLVIATGTTPRPDETPGLREALSRGAPVHEFYTLEGAARLADALAEWPGGRLVVNIMETPIKCPVAPLEFAFLADAWFRERKMRDLVELVYVTPMSDVFTKPVASRELSHMLDDRKIQVETDFYVESVDVAGNAIVSYDEREVGYDLLVTVPVNMGADFVARSGLGDELNHVAVDKHTFQSEAHDNLFAIGDAASLPTSKAGSVAHFAAEVFAKNFLALLDGKPMTEAFDGHANCFVESGDGKAMLIDFNYDIEPLPGKYPIPKVGPFSLLAESPINHIGKLGFRWVYWNMLLPGRPIPLPHHMSTAGKDLSALDHESTTTTEGVTL